MLSAPSGVDVLASWFVVLARERAEMTTEKLAVVGSVTLVDDDRPDAVDGCTRALAGVPAARRRCDVRAPRAVVARRRRAGRRRTHRHARREVDPAARRPSGWRRGCRPRARRPGPGALDDVARHHPPRRRCDARFVVIALVGPSVRSADTSCHASVPIAATSRLPFVIVPPARLAVSVQRANVAPPERRARPASPAMTPLVLFFMVLFLSVGCPEGRQHDRARASCKDSSARGRRWSRLRCRPGSRRLRSWGWSPRCRA